MDILRDPATATVIGLAALVAAVFLYRIGQRRKELACDDLSTTAALTPREEFEGHLKITFDGKPIRDVSIVLCQIFNSGNEPIQTHDFVRPLTVAPTAGTILSVEIIEMIPSGLEATVELVDGRARLAPLLLNKKEVVTLRLVATEYRGPLVFDARIVGVSRLSTVQGGRWFTAVGYALTVVGIIEAACVAIIVLALIPGFETLDKSLRGLVMVVAIVLATTGFYSWLRLWSYGPRGSSPTYRRVLAERARARRPRTPADP